MGIAHDTIADPTRAGKRWDVDLVPLILASDEWRPLEAALIQRARLLNAIVADIYGEQRLMREGFIPSIFSIRLPRGPCQGIEPAAGHVQFYAVDIAREVNGNWRVIDNHTETPAGVGYALANRVVHNISPAISSSTCNALRLAPFFQRVQAGRDAAQRQARSAHCPAHARPASRGLFQPRISGALPRLPAVSRRHAYRWRPRIPEDARRSEAHRPHRALRRRPRMRSARA